ncbi:MAG: FCD domain-containing protein [Treponema sp.]|nr:FCD domain-containing protein [Treponema sp.]
MRDRMEDTFVKRFETEILSGQYVPGDRLPAERDLAESHGVSRPVVHGAMRQLAARGLLRIEARRGIFVSDFRREGSVEMLLSLINFAGGDLAPGILDGLLEMRLLIETETARLAALRAAPDELADIERVLAREVLFEYREPRDATLIDFDFHFAVALASGNSVYPLLLNSLKKVYEKLLDRYYADPSVIPEVFEMHRNLAKAIEAQSPGRASEAMRQILDFGEAGLRALMASRGGPS